MIVELYIEDDKITINEDVFLNSQINSIGELKIKTNVTNQFRIAKDNNTSKIFEFIDDINSASTLPYTVSDARLIVNGVEYIHKGQLVITKVDKDFHVIVREGNSNFFNQLEGKTLRDLDLSAHNFVWTLSNIEAARTNTNTWNFLIIDWGILGTNFDVRYALPCLPLYIVINAIFTEAGWTKSGTFWSSSPYTEMFLPCVNKRITSTIVNNMLSQMSKTADVAYGGGNTSGGVRFDNTVSDTYTLMSEITVSGDTTTIYTAPTPGRYTFEWKIYYTLSTIDPSPDASLIARRYDVDDTLIETNTITSITTVSTPPYDDVTITWTTDCNIGDYVYLFAAAPVADTFTILGVAASSTYQVTAITEISDSNLGIGFDIAANMPNMLQKTLIEDVAKAYGLIFDPNPLSLDIAASKYEDFQDKKDSGTFVNWSSKLKTLNLNDIPKSFQNKNYAQRNYFRYTHDETVADGIGDSYFDIADINLNTEVEKVRLRFSACQSTTKFTITIPIIKSYTEEDNAVIEFAERNPRWAIYENEATGVTIDYTDGTTTDTISTNIPSCYFIDSSKSTDLGWANLLADNYADLQTILASYKEMMPYLDLNMADFSQINHLNPYFINGLGWFILEKVERFKDEGLTKCKMVKM